MKKYFVAIVLVSMPIISFGQAIIANPQNSSGEGGELILKGSTASENSWHLDNLWGNFRMFHSGKEYLKMTNAGNLGIGTSTPQTKLHLNVANSNSELLRLDNNGLRTTSFFNYSDGTSDNAGLQFKKNSTVGQFKFSNKNGDLMTILPDGEVHILNSNINSELLRLDNNGLRTTSFFNYSDGNYNNAGLQFKKNSTVGQFKFSNTNGDLMTILSNGVIKIERASTSDNNSPGLVAVSNDDFKYDNQYINQYGFGFHGYQDGTTDFVEPLNSYMSGHFGLDFFTGAQNRMRINRLGEVTIGTVNRQEGYKLAVNGKIRAKEIKVDTNWADYVFKDDYQLPTLAEVAQHIAEKGHLINIPSEAEVAENGIQLGAMNAKLLEKIEELTLYTLEQEEKLKAQEARLAKLEGLLISK